MEDASKRRGQFTFDSPMTGSMEVVSDDMTMYMRSDLFAAALGGKAREARR